MKLDAFIFQSEKQKEHTIKPASVNFLKQGYYFILIFKEIKYLKKRKLVKKSIVVGLACFISMFLIFISSLHGKGLAVSPASYTWELRRFGEKVKMPVGIMIINQSKKKCLYRLRTKTPKEIDAGTDVGFMERLKAEWVSFDEPLIEVLPQSAREVSVYIKIPKRLNKVGRTWVFYVEVKEEIFRYGYMRGQPDAFALACYPKISVTTKPE